MAMATWMRNSVTAASAPSMIEVTEKASRMPILLPCTVRLDRLGNSRYDEHMSTTRELIQQAASLPEAERVQIVVELLATLDGPPDSDHDQAWAAEIARRSREIKSGEVEGIVWDEVKASARARLRGNT